MVWAIRRAMLRELRFANSRGAPKVPHGTSRNDKPVRHALCHAKLDDIGAVALRTVDHDAVLTARRGHAHLRRSFDQSSSASRFTAGASDVAEVRALGLSGA